MGDFAVNNLFIINCPKYINKTRALIKFESGVLCVTKEILQFIFK